MTSTNRLDAEVRDLQKRGVTLPKHPARARQAASEMSNLAGSLSKQGVVFPGPVNMTSPQNGATIRQIEENNRLTRAMGDSRRLSSQRKMGSGSGMGGDVWAALPRFYDPLEYWDLSGLPWNMADEGHRHKLHKWLRLYRATHYLVPILIDIFTRFPLVGMDLYCKDTSLEDFYSQLFLDQLNYGEFLVKLGTEYWTVGEAFPLGSFDEDLGIWEREELINPEDVVIKNFPLLGSQQMLVSPPDYLKKLALERAPAKEYRQLELNFPDLIPYLKRNENIPISPVLLKQVAHKINPWDDHGTPILLRGLRTLMHEEKLMASQDAIAERLYSPLVLAKLGVMDLGDQQGPWIPSPDELDAFRDDMDTALSSDFRLLVHHFGVDIQNVFGREQMPRLGDDFDRIERRIMQIFGVNPSLLSAGNATQPYASSALQAEFLNQILRTFQDYLKRHFRERALVVAEAQGHYDYEKRGQTRVKIMEEVVVFDEEGNKTIESRPKLLIPELEFQTLDLRDEATERQFLQTLRAMGVPISDERMMVGVHFRLDDENDLFNDELVKKTVKQQEAKMKTYTILKAKNLPIPPDLKAEVESVIGGGTPAPGSPAALPGGMPGGPPGGGPAMGPQGGPGENIVMPSPPGDLLGPTGMGGSAGPPAAGPGPQTGPAGGSYAPAVSMERRPGMPSPTSAEKKSYDEGSDWLEERCEHCGGELADKDGKVKCKECGKEHTVVKKLPESKIAKKDRKKKYSILDDDAEPLKEVDESTDEQPRTEPSGD